MTDIEIILRPSRNWGTIYANSPDGRRWIIRNVNGHEASGVAATFAAEFLQVYLARAAESGITVTVKERRHEYQGIRRIEAG
jgi:hypothetical protein